MSQCDSDGEGTEKMGGCHRRSIQNGGATDKLSFDDAFAVITRHNSLHFHLVINSNRTFHQLNIGVWDILQQHRIWFDKPPGPISKTDLVPMGFWLHIHPCFASTHSFNNQLCRDISKTYAVSPVVAEMKLPTEFTDPDVYFTPSKYKGTYDKQVINSNALCMYGSRADFDHTTTMITRISSFATTIDDKSPMYVPFALKTSHPEVFGQYLAQQNAFLESHRNIAIVGVHPVAMDYGDTDHQDPAFTKSLWNILSQMNGIYRVDSCRRTFDLGKWNISCHASHHQAITQWIDTNLVNIWKQVPLALPIYPAFSTPERLSCNRGVRSVASGLTDASPVSHYLKSLADRHQTSSKLTTVVRNPWRQTPPVQSVVYQFNKTDYPLPGGDTDATAPTTDSTMVAASAITASEGYDASVQLSVDRKLTAYEASRAENNSDFNARMNMIEDKIQGSKMSSRLLQTESPNAALTDSRNLTVSLLSKTPKSIFFPIN
jgi:hypothetical protein